MGSVTKMRGFVGDTLQNLVSMLGTDRDKAYHNQFLFEPMDRAQLEAAYRGDWVAKKVVNVPAKDATREGRQWQAENADIEAIENEEKRLGVLPKLTSAMIKARLYGGGALVMGLGDDPSQPIRLETVKKGGLRYLHALACHDLRSGELVEDVSDPDFGLPAFYTLNSGTTGLQEIKVHRSRVVRLVGDEYPDRTLQGVGDTWGDSVLHAVRDAVMNVAASTGAISYLIQEMKLDIVKMPNFMKKVNDPQYKSEIMARFALTNQAKSLTSTLIMDREEEWNRVNASFAGLPDVMKLYLLIASGAADIPATRLLGQSAVGLNSTGEGDVRNYYDHVASVQETTLTPALATLDDVLIRSALGARPKDIWYEWAPLWQLTEAEKAEIAAKKATTTKTYVDAGVVEPDILEKVVFNQLVEDGTYPGIEQARDAWEAEGGGVDEEDEEVQAQFERQKAAMVDPDETTPEGRPRMRVVGQDKEFDQSQVDRDESGKFSSGGGGGGGEKKVDSAKMINAPTKGTSSERVALRAALKAEKESALRSGLQSKILMSFKTEYDKVAAKGNSAKASELAAKSASYAKQYGKPDPVSVGLTTQQANSGYSQKEQTAGKEVAVSVGVTGSAYTPHETAAFNDLVSMVGANEAKNYASKARQLIGKNSELQMTGITPGEAAHIGLYTGSGYRAVNGALRSGIMTEAQWNHVAQLNAALDKLPDYQGTTWRGGPSLGTNEFEKNYPVGRVVEERAFTSSSYQQKAAFGQGQSSGKVKYVIESKTGKKIDYLSVQGTGEREVLFRAGTRFKVTKADSYSQTVYMEEVGYGTKKV